MKDTIVISAFPACGKSWITAHNTSKIVLDSDSSEFSWTTYSTGKKVRNKNFPNNYIEHIKDNIGKADVIFVSTHLVVREALTAAGIRFVTVYPKKHLKDEWLNRCCRRGNDSKFIDLMDSSWDKYMDSVYSEPTGEKLYTLRSGEHLSDMMDIITREWKSRTCLKNMVDDDVPLLELSWKEINDMAAEYFMSKSRRAIKGHYEISKHKNEIHISATQTLAEASSYCGKLGCGFLKHESGSYSVWQSGHNKDIEKFCKPFMNVFLAQVEKICDTMELMISDDAHSSVSVDEDGLLCVQLSVKTIEIEN